MNEPTWLSSADPADMLRHLTQEFAHAAGAGGVWVGRKTPLVSDRQLRLWVEACRVMTGVVGGSAPDSDLQGAVEAWCVPGLNSTRLLLAMRAAVLRDIVGNPWKPLVVPESMPGKACMDWINDHTVRQLAQAAYEVSDHEAYNLHHGCPDCLSSGHAPGLDPDLLLTLADALEDAGCTDAVVLMHLRGKDLCLGCIPWPDAKNWVPGHTPGGIDPYWLPCLKCNATSWITKRGPCVRGCHVIEMLRGGE